MSNPFVAQSYEYHTILLTHAFLTYNDKDWQKK